MIVSYIIISIFAIFILYHLIKRLISFIKTPQIPASSSIKNPEIPATIHDPELINRADLRLSILTHNLSWELLSGNKDMGHYRNYSAKYIDNSELAMDDMYKFLSDIINERNINILLLQEITEPFIDLLRKKLSDRYNIVSHKNENSPAIVSILYDNKIFSETPIIIGHELYHGRPICIAIFHNMKTVIITAHDDIKDYEQKGMIILLSKIFADNGIDNRYIIILGGDFNNAVDKNGIKINDIVLKEPDAGLLSCCIFIKNSRMYLATDHILSNKEIVDYGMKESKFEDTQLSDHNLIYANI